MTYDLSIDTSVRGETTIIVVCDGKEVYKVCTTSENSSQSVVPAVEDACRVLSITPQSFGSVRVHTGPGSYTGLRVGAAVGQALAAYFGIPINGHSPEKPIEFQYDAGDRWA
jgi:tRNA threonylcarbamoyladenosine biosynthesis protein TsaB